MCSPHCCVDTIEHWNDECRVVYLESTVETYDLTDSRYRQENESKDRRRLTELVAGVLVRQAAGYKFNAAKVIFASANHSEEAMTKEKNCLFYSRGFREDQGSASETTPTTRPPDAECPRDTLVVMRSGPHLQVVTYSEHHA